MVAMSIRRRLWPSVYTVITVPVFVVLYTFTGVSVLLIWPFAFSGRKRVVKSLIRFWSIMIFLLMGKRLRVKGIENIVPGKKYVLLANHASLFDITAILAFYPGISWFGREHLLRIPVFGHILKMIDYIPMSAADIRNTRRMLDQLVQKSEGNSIAMFPEGTRTINGEISYFRRGFIHLIRGSNLDILPVTLNGFHSLKPKNRFWIDFGSKINVVIHPAIANGSLKLKTDLEIIHQLRTTIQSAYQLSN